jgi:hypothetical protein
MLSSHRKCQACSMLFAVDPRNSERQRFCSNPDCQRERRRREQRWRRTPALERLCSELVNDDPKAARRLQKASRIPEALIDTQSPILVGLISMLIDSKDREEISKTLRRLWERGSTSASRCPGLPPGHGPGHRNRASSREPAARRWPGWVAGRAHPGSACIRPRPIAVLPKRRVPCHDLG